MNTFCWLTVLFLSIVNVGDFNWIAKIWIGVGILAFFEIMVNIGCWLLETLKKRP